MVGAQTQPLDWKLPDGLTLPLPANAQLMVQVHWLNTTAQPIDGNVDISFHPAERPGQHVGVLFGIDKQVAMRPQSGKRVSHFCPLPEGAQVIAMMGHFHTLGRAYGVWVRGAGETQAQGRQVYKGLDENTLEFKDFTPTVSIGANQGLEFQCDFFNSRDIPISWGPDTNTQEHCNMAAYYFPAREQDDGFCIKDVEDRGTIVGVTAEASVLSSGASTRVTVEMDAAVEADTEITLRASDSTAISIPLTVNLPAHARSVTFLARALRPVSGVVIHAALGIQVRSLNLRVTGLLLSEVYLGETSPGAIGPWVEIANTTSMPVDLSQYRLNVGDVASSGMTLPLSGTLAPHGCVVVGSNQVPSIPGSAMVLRGLPSVLPTGTTAPLGIGLFEMNVEAGSVGSKTDLAVDGVSYRSASDGLDSSTGKTLEQTSDPGAAFPLLPAANPGASVMRVAGSQWLSTMVPTPGICEVRGTL